MLAPCRSGHHTQARHREEPGQPDLEPDSGVKQRGPGALRRGLSNLPTD